MMVVRVTLRDKSFCFFSLQYFPPGALSMSHDLRAPMSDDTLAAWRHLVAEYAAIDWMSYDGNIHRTADRYRHIPTAVWLEIMDELIARRAAAVSPPQTPEEELKKLRALVEWQGDELSKRMACVKCGEEPHPRSELYSTVCPSCRMCFACCEPMCPTCGDRDGTKQRAIDLRNENEKLRQRLDAAPAPAEPSVTLAGLIAKWREVSQRAQRDAEMARRVDDGAEGMYNDGRAVTYERCADELEAALVASRQGQNG